MSNIKSLLSWVLSLFIVLFASLIVYFIIKSAFIVYNYKPQNETWETSSITWVEIINIEDTTGTTDTGYIIPYIPDNIRDYIDYITIYGTWWDDFIEFFPKKPQIIRSSDKEENNAIMYDYVKRYSYKFNIKSNKIWYILFITSKEIPDNKDFFLALNWKVRWHIKKSSSLPVNNYNEYLYRLNAIPLVEWWTVAITKDTPMSAFIWEWWNYIKKIIVVFK